MVAAKITELTEKKLAALAESLRRWRVSRARSRWAFRFAPRNPRTAEAVEKLQAAHAEVTRVADRYGATSPEYYQAYEAMRSAERAVPWWWR